MAIDHKRVKELIYRERGKITDKQFFTSRLLAGHFEEIAQAQTRRYGYRRRIKVHIIWNKDLGFAARINHSIIEINAGNECVTGIKGRPDRYNMISGLFAHELGHALYTDFLGYQTHLLRLAAGVWFPKKPKLSGMEERRNERELWDYCRQSPAHQEAFLKVAHEIANVLEDAYLEEQMLDRYPGQLGQNLAYMRARDFEDQPTVTQLLEREDDEDNWCQWLTLIQLILCYVRWGEIKYGDTSLKHERIQTIFRLIPVMDQSVLTHDSHERMDAINRILVRLWPEIKEFLQLCEEKAKQAQQADPNATGNSAGNQAGSLMSQLTGGSGEATGDTQPVPLSQAPIPTRSPAAAKRRQTARQAASASAPSSGTRAADEEENPAAENDPNGDEKAVEAETPIKSPSDQPEEKNFGDSETSAGGAEQVHSVETGRIPYHQTEQVEVPVTGDMEYDESYIGSGYPNAASDIERVLDKLAEARVHEAVETERRDELNEIAQNISFGDAHEGVPVAVHRMPAVSDELIAQYDAISPPLLRISKQLQSSITHALEDRRRGGKQTGLYMGRNVHAPALMRTDGRVFYRNILPNEMPELAVGLLLDESGSMSGYDRATYARATAIILHDFCLSLGIPIMIYGHSTSGHRVDLFSHAEDDVVDRNDRYRLMDISARSTNRDGAALRFVAERLSMRPEEYKLLIIVSDGQPNHSGYSGTAAEEDLRGIKKEFHHKGVYLVAAAIGSDKENIERIYTDSFLDITDLEQLPVKLTEKIKSFIHT